MAKISYSLGNDSIPYSPILGTALGVCGALILQQTYYWCAKNKERGINFKDGHYWTYNTYHDLALALGGFTERTIRRNVAFLVERGLLIVDRHNSLGFDKTNWYRIDVESVYSLLSASGQIGQSMWPKWPVHVANLSVPIPETNTETKTKNKTLATQNPKPKSNSENEMLKKNNMKGPTTAATAVEKILTPPSVKKETMVMGLYKVWASNVPKHHESIKFVGPFSMKQKGLMAQCGNLWGEKAVMVLGLVIGDWIKFCKYVNAQAGTKGFPEVPSLEYLTKHRELAMNFFLGVGTAKDSELQLTAKPPAKVGGIIFKKATKTTTTTPPVSPMESPTKPTDGDPDDAPASLEFLLGLKYGKPL